MRSRLYLLSSLLPACLGCLLPMQDSEAATRIVHARGAAAIVGNDIASARKAALAEALYDAAGQGQSSVRGASHMSTLGVANEESSILVQGRIRDYQVVEEKREGGRYVVTIDALADNKDDLCKTGRKFDLELRSMSVNVAPGLSGHVQKQAEDSVERALYKMVDSEGFRVEDRRNLYQSSRQSSPNQYQSIITGQVPINMVGGYSVNGTMVVERTRRDTLALNITALKATVTLRLTDTLTGQMAPTVQKTMEMPIKKRVWGSNYDTLLIEAADFEGLWDKVADGLQEMLECQPLRARVIEVSGSNARLSVGNRNGIKAGDYFLVEFPGQKGQGWQLMVIESTGPTTSVARMMKPTPVVTRNATAVLMQ